MNQTVSYEKVYEKSDYKQQYEELRNRYRERTENALQNGNKIDRHPIPNATTVVFLHDNHDGTVHITTGDFVEYFNQCYGGSDRVQAARRMISNAKRKTEINRDFAQQQLKARKKECRGGMARRVRSAGRRLSFVNAMFAMMLVFSIVLLAGTSLVLNRAENRVSTLRAEIEEEGDAQINGNTSEVEMLRPQEGESYLSYSGTDSVEIYDTEDSGGIAMGTLLNALSALAGKS